LVPLGYATERGGSTGVFESLKARLEQLFRADSVHDLRARSAALRDALLEAKVGVSGMRSALAATENELAEERRRLEDAERRGRLAAELPDTETVALAERYTQRHRDRIGVLERKVAVQRDELAMAEREMGEILQEYRTSRSGRPFGSIDAAWRELEAAGAERPGLGLDDRSSGSDSDEKLKQAVEAQLAYLKRKLGKDKT
jgi:hypothetical protein